MGQKRKFVITLLLLFDTQLVQNQTFKRRKGGGGGEKLWGIFIIPPTCLKPPTVCMPFISNECVHTHYKVSHYNPKPTCACINWEQLESQKTYVRHDSLRSKRGFLLDIHVQTLHRVTTYTQTHDQVFSSAKWWLVASVIPVTYQKVFLFPRSLARKTIFSNLNQNINFQWTVTMKIIYIKK